MFTETSCYTIFIDYLYSQFCRFKTNDTDLLDECSFTDPRTKALSHLTVDKRERVKQRIISLIHEDDGDSVSEIVPDPGSSSQGSSADESKHDLLSSLLSDFQPEQPVPTFISRSEAQLEVVRYLAEPYCPMKGDPLAW